MLLPVTVTTSNVDQTAEPVNPAEPPHEDARSSRWRGHREARRAELVAAAVRAVHRHGAGVGMDDIAAEAGVSKPILYRHFADKADLYAAVGQHAATALMETIDAELAQQREPRAHLATVIDAYLRSIEAEPELYRFVVHRSFAGREDDPIAGYTRLIATRVARILADRLAEAGRPAGGAEAWAHGMVGLVQSAGDWWLHRGVAGRAALTDDLTSLLWNGVGGILAGEDRHPSNL